MGKKENKIEQPVCDYAKTQGFTVRKLKYIAVDGAPDRMFFGHGLIFFIEFKAPDDGKLSPAQIREIGKLQDAGIKVFIIDSVEHGKLIVDGAVQTGAQNAG